MAYWQTVFNFSSFQKLFNTKPTYAHLIYVFVVWRIIIIILNKVTFFVYLFSFFYSHSDLTSGLNTEVQAPGCSSLRSNGLWLSEL